MSAQYNREGNTILIGNGFQQGFYTQLPDGTPCAYGACTWSDDESIDIILDGDKYLLVITMGRDDNWEEISRTEVPGDMAVSYPNMDDQSDDYGDPTGWHTLEELTAQNRQQQELAN